jgi:hypothetical protein
MTTCSVRWRSSGGRGEFEFVPSDSLEDRDISVFFEPLDITIPAEVRGVKAQGKPRLRKFEKNNRQKLHLPQLVMAAARLPEPAREDHHNPVQFPLENKAFVMNEMEFDVIEDDGLIAILAPLRVSILHSNFQIDLQDRLKAIAGDVAAAPAMHSEYPDLSDAIMEHYTAVADQINSSNIRIKADAYIKAASKHFGMTNAGSASALLYADNLPESDIEEEITGKEGRLLTRLHSYKERDRPFSKKVKKHYKGVLGGKLRCMACDMVPIEKYGGNGDKCIEAHHKIPIEELQPDSVTRVEDMAVICASCHRIVHSKKPCLTIEEVRTIVGAG